MPSLVLRLKYCRVPAEPWFQTRSVIQSITSNERAQSVSSYTAFHSPLLQRQRRSKSVSCSGNFALHFSSGLMPTHRHNCAPSALILPIVVCRQICFRLLHTRIRFSSISLTISLQFLQETPPHHVSCDGRQHRKRRAHPADR